jgi:peptide/nickel transport system ATP-binding protein
VTNSSSPYVVVENLRIDIHTSSGLLHAVSNVSFQLPAGEVLCIVGESGSGKSMTALGLMGLLPAAASRSAERLSVEGRDLLTMSPEEKSDFLGNRMAMIFQEPMTSLNPCFTIGTQMVETIRRHRNVSGQEAKLRASRWLEKVGIPSTAGRLEQYPHQLSGGLRQRVMIAMMLMCEPKLLIADEPTTALDVTVQAQILQLLSALQRELGLTMIFITHDLGVVSRIADRVAVMYAGQFVEYGTTRQVLKTPQHPYTQGLLKCLPVPGRTRRGAHLGTIPGSVPSLIGNLSGCCFANRCEYAAPICREGKLPLSLREDEHGVRCRFRPDEFSPVRTLDAVSQ